VNRIGAKLASVVLAALFAWAAFAVFSPVHKHDLRAPAKCSLNHLESQQAEGAVAVLPDFTLALVGRSQPVLETERAGHWIERRLPARAPPASSC
jgi:hypothetical protein